MDQKMGRTTPILGIFTGNDIGSYFRSNWFEHIVFRFPAGRLVIRLRTLYGT